MLNPLTKFFKKISFKKDNNPISRPTSKGNPFSSLPPSSPCWRPHSPHTLIRDGYETNPIVFRCVRMIAESAAHVTWRIYEDDHECVKHPVLDLLSKPNPYEIGSSFLETLYAYLQLFGNAFVVLSLNPHQKEELYILRPDRVSISPRQDGWPQTYIYYSGDRRMTYPAEQNGMPVILHVRAFHPLNDLYGFSPLQAAQTATEAHNAATLWNKSLLDHAACPSGALVYAGPSGQNLSNEQYDRLKEELETSFTGARSAGRPLLLEGGMDWKAFSLSPKDMDFNEAKATAAREIALAFGVPPLLLGLPGDNTRTNFQEANRAFWRQTIIPLVTRIQKSFENWLQPVYGPFRIDYDVDRIDALAEERRSEWTRINDASFLSTNEKREALGYGPL